MTPMTKTISPCSTLEVNERSPVMEFHTVCWLAGSCSQAWTWLAWMSSSTCWPKRPGTPLAGPSPAWPEFGKPWTAPAARGTPGQQAHQRVQQVHDRARDEQRREHLLDGG